MKLRAVSGIMLTLLIGMLILAFNIQLAETESTTIIVPDDYPTIQEAINNAGEGDTVYVRAGTYYENLIINKTVSLFGENKSTTIIVGNGTDSVIWSVASPTWPHFVVSGFTIRNGGLGIWCGNNAEIKDNIISHNNIGIEMMYDNIVIQNMIHNNKWGGLLVFEGGHNIIYHNNFINNTNWQAGFSEWAYNAWDNGYPSGGNYWSDYEEKYPDAKQLNGSGIWDTPYVIGANNQDNYPLVNPWTPIDTISPSIETISRTPLTPNYDQDVTVTAGVTDNVEVDEAMLSYTDSSEWHNVSMNRFDYTFNATIPAQPYGTLVQYRIYANDTNGNWDVSDLFSYTVIDVVEPQILGVSRNPVQPRSNQIVNVLANVSEPVNASGVKNVTFYYRVNDNPWWSTNMILNKVLNLWETTIPAQQPYDIVEYYTRAEDNAGNEDTSETYSYIVALAGDANIPNGAPLPWWLIGVLAVVVVASIGAVLAVIILKKRKALKHR